MYEGVDHGLTARAPVAQTAKAAIVDMGEFLSAAYARHG